MTDVPELIMLRDAPQLGISIDDVLRRARAGQLVRIHPGAYMPTEVWTQMRPEQQLRARVIASHRRQRGDPVYSHESAAVILGIPLLGQLPMRPHVLDTSSAARSSPAMRRTIRRVEPSDTVTSDGIRTTSPLLTALDLAATRSPLGGVIAISGVRHRYAISADEFAARLTGAPFRGIRRVRVALATSSGGCQSALESVVLARCEDLGFERPEQQRVIVTARGEFLADFAWDDGRIVLEADGYVKYTDAAMLAGRAPADAVIAEKHREDAIRDVVDAFGRTTWREALDGAPLERVLERIGVPRIRRARALRR